MPFSTAMPAARARPPKKLFMMSGDTFDDTRTSRLAIRSRERSERLAKVGGVDGARTRDLRRDRPAF